ncbi:Spc97 [Tritrichomonas foetus]|uniref:Spc97 n=1 Tax=Tritrichomonas foetus TaxID=1144522 RepID=A0A1J4JUQ9_9EUKA|nr:Spc97 [Tritrichomonas foetus]|eukprot:OHT02887.1 Spc97 [Tritrichomonas foetus]
MNDEDFLDPSYLISRLVQCFCPNDLNALSHAVDILRSFNFNQCTFETSVFRYRWISDLEENGKHEEIKILNKSIENIVQTINRPNSLFLLLDQLKASYSIPLINPEKPFKSQSLPTDFLFVLQGLEGKNFKWNLKQHRFVSSEKVQPNLYSCVQKVNNIGCMVKTILAFLDFADSLIHQYAACTVREIYVNHLDYVSTIEASFPDMTPNQLLTFLSGPPIDDLKAAAIICTTIETMRASSIYNVLNYIAQHGDKSMVSIAIRMREKALEGIEYMIKSWVTKGTVDDPFFEFFIQIKGDVEIYSNWWHDRYFIAKAIVPHNLSEDIVKKIFSAGKALNFVRTFDQPVELEIDNSLPLETFVDMADKQANAHILSLIMHDDLFSIALHDIQCFVLLQRGDFTTDFINKDPNQVKLGVQTIISQYANRNIENISYDSSILPTGGFRYDAKSPLSSILGPNEVRAYRVVSAVLLRLKRTEQKVNNSVFLFKSVQLLAFEMRTFIGLIGDYLNIQVIHKSYETMKSVILKGDILFDDLLRSHTQHVSNIARGCWITKSGEACRVVLYKLLNVIDQISNLNNVKFSKENNLLTNKIRCDFYQTLKEFNSALLQHKISGIELAPPLTRMFRNVFK